jgi:hypothetical protein
MKCSKIQHFVWRLKGVHRVVRSSRTAWLQGFLVGAARRDPSVKPLFNLRNPREHPRRVCRVAADRSVAHEMLSYFGRKEEIVGCCRVATNRCAAPQHNVREGRKPFRKRRRHVHSRSIVKKWRENNAYTSFVSGVCRKEGPVQDLRRAFFAVLLNEAVQFVKQEARRPRGRELEVFNH